MTEFNFHIIPDVPTQGKILYAIDCYLREVIEDEDLLMWWLEEGCPDGCEDWQEVAALLDEEGTTFQEWIALANTILAKNDGK